MHNEGKHKSPVDEPNIEHPIKDIPLPVPRLPTPAPEEGDTVPQTASRNPLQSVDTKQAMSELQADAQLMLLDAIDSLRTNGIDAQM